MRNATEEMVLVGNVVDGGHQHEIWVRVLRCLDCGERYTFVDELDIDTYRCCPYCGSDGGKSEAENERLREECTALRKARKREFEASCEAATSCMGQIGTLRDENAELRELVRDMWRDGMCECDERDACAECEYHFPGRMRELRIEVG